MSLAPEAAAFLGRPPPRKHPEAKAVHGYAGLAHHGVTHKREPTEEAPESHMPKGVYERKKKPAKAVEKPEAKPRKKRGPKPKAAKAAMRKIRELVDKAPPAARFGVFDDGTIEFRLPTCAGVIQPAEAREFLGFLKRIGVE